MTFSVGWLGAVLAYLVIAIAGLTSVDLEKVRSTYAVMPLVAWFAIVPLAIAPSQARPVRSRSTAASSGRALRTEHRSATAMQCWSSGAV